MQDKRVDLRIAVAVIEHRKRKELQLFVKFPSGYSSIDPLIFRKGNKQNEKRYASFLLYHV